MTKTKFLMPLVVLLVMGMATSAFAQMSCNVASTPVSRATATGHTEQAGDLIFNCSAVGGVATLPATMTLSYGGAIITNTAAFPVGRPIDVTSVSGGLTVAPPDIPNDNSTVSNSTGQVVVNIPAQPAGSPAGSFSVTGVLVSLNGTGFTQLETTVSVSQGTGVLITAGQNVATVITSIQQGINTTTAPPALAAGSLAALYPSTSAVTPVAPVPGRGTFTIVITENYIDMLREAAQYAGASNDTQLAVTFSGLATGSSITGCGATVTSPAGVVSPTAVAALSATTVTVAAPTLTVTFTGTLDQSQIEQVRIACTGFAITLATTPQPLTTAITATVTLSPTGSALSGAGAPITTAPGNGIPRYQSTPISIGTVLAFTPNTTTFIIPFAIGDPSTTAPAGAFDTGIAIANTTGETIGGTGIFSTGGAQAQAGTVTLHFFPSSGTAADRFSVTTASVASGASYVANVSEILRGAGRTASFIGYIIGVANFTNGHGMAFLYGGTAAGRITSATDVLTISSPINAARSAFAAPIGLEITSK